MALRRKPRRAAIAPLIALVRARCRSKTIRTLSTSARAMLSGRICTMRMHMRRYTRLTNGFSKKVENHAHSMALFTTYYNFVRIHKTLRVTPAMAAGVTDKLWEVSDIVAVLEKWEAAQV